MLLVYMCYGLTQKLVRQKITRTRLNVCVGEFSAELDPPPEHFVYFMPMTDEPIPTPNSSDEADQLLQAYFDVGVVSGHSLEMLEQLLTQVNEFSVSVHHFLTALTFLALSLQRGVGDFCFLS